MITSMISNGRESIPIVTARKARPCLEKIIRKRTRGRFDHIDRTNYHKYITDINRNPRIFSVPGGLYLFS